MGPKTGGFLLKIIQLFFSVCVFVMVPWLIQGCAGWINITLKLPVGGSKSLFNKWLVQTTDSVRNSKWLPLWMGNHWFTQFIQKWIKVFLSLCTECWPMTSEPWKLRRTKQQSIVKLCLPIYFTHKLKNTIIKPHRKILKEPAVN